MSVIERDDGTPVEVEYRALIEWAIGTPNRFGKYRQGITLPARDSQTVQRITVRATMRARQIQSNFPKDGIERPFRIVVQARTHTPWEDLTPSRESE